MTHWRKPTYTIETEFGTLRDVPEGEAEAIENYSSEAPRRFILQKRGFPGWVYIPGMVLLVSVVIVGLRYLIGG